MFETIAELYDKMEWEGGVLDLIFSYGVSSDKLPSETPFEIRAAWERIEAVSLELRLIEEWLEDNADEGRVYE